MRKAVTALCVGIFFVTLGTRIWLDFSYSANLPGAPVPNTGHTNEVVVNHGFVRYATHSQVRSLYWADVAIDAGMVCALLGGLLNVLHEDKNGGESQSHLNA